MKVTLLNHTHGAMDLLLRTKNTRLANTEDDPKSWTEEKKAEHLAYMKDTIKSSWEFVDYVFEITGVTRAFTHQLVRSRTGSYAQESQRTVDASGNGYLNPFPDDHSASYYEFRDACNGAFEAYKTFLYWKVPAQDARGVLPTATLTSIVAKFNLRTLHEMSKVRLCVRTQGEYQDVFRAMRDAVIAVHPWVEEYRFMEVACVAEGTCAFPRYGKSDCRFYDPAMDLSALKEATRLKFWSGARQEARPQAKGGRTM